MAILHPQECYLLEYFLSLEYYGQWRDAMVTYIDFLEDRLAHFKNNLPLDLRSRPLWQQVDVVWDGRIMPNLRPMRDSAIEAYILRSHNDPRAFGYGGGMAGWLKHKSDFYFDWMTEAEQTEERRLFSDAEQHDCNIDNTINRYWCEGDLTYNYKPEVFGVYLPNKIPVYELDPSCRIEIGQLLSEDGLYLPDISDAPATYLIDFCQFLPSWPQSTPDAMQGTVRSIDEDTGQEVGFWDERTWTPTAWTRIRRVEGAWIEVPPDGFFTDTEDPTPLYQWPETAKRLEQAAQTLIHANSGTPCPHSGQWGALIDYRIEYQTFQQGQILPMAHSQIRGEYPVRWTLLKREDEQL